MSFDDDIALRPAPDGDGRLCDISENHWVVAGPNGGYLAALAAAAGDQHANDPARQLRSLTVHYLRRPEAGPARLRTAALHEGRSTSFLRTDFVQNGRTIVTATGAWATSREGIEHDAWSMPDVGPPDACPPMSTVRPEGPLPIHGQWDIRAASDVAFDSGGDAELTWWIRPPVHRRLDGAMLVAMADALPPPIFVVTRSAMGVPTMDLTVHIRADLAAVPWTVGDWVLAHFRTRRSHAGYVEEDGELWTADGTLLANSRQLSVAL